MRVISGKYGGRKLTHFRDPRIRPTTDRVKESLFNILSTEVEGARVLDLFAGTGSLGIEALSRGAREVTFVDQSASSLRIVRQNLSLLKVPQNQFRLIRFDALAFLSSADHDFDLVFIDPPFTQRMADLVMTAVARAHWTQIPTLAIETAKDEKILDQYGFWRRFRVNNYGDKALSLFKLELQKV
jgi:16S rRNA (guanine(966)-N(2))-methyltransferase RsmD